MKKVRNSNLEILRIISIVMIVISHYCIHGGIDTTTMPLGINRFLLEFFTLGNYGSILFILISGYFLINCNEIKLKKIIKLLLQVFFYSIIIYIILLLLGKESFSIINLIKCILPVTYKQYWFATVYMVIYIFSPFINKLLNSLSRKEHLIFICSLFAIFSILQTFTNMDYYGNELTEFIMFYSIGAYLSKYPKNILEKSNIKISLISILLIACSIISFDLLGTRISFFASNSRYLLSRTSPFSILFCIGLFDWFTRKKQINNQIINKISGLIFGVYLISDNNYIRKILWIDTFKNASYVSSPYLILHLLITIIITIIVCLIIEYIRKKLEILIFKKMDSKIDKLQNRIINTIHKKNSLLTFSCQ